MLCPTSLPQKDTDPSSCFRLCNFAFVCRSIFALFLCALFSPFFLPFRAVFAFLYAVFAFWVLPPCCSHLCRLSLVRCSHLFGPSCVRCSCLFGPSVCCFCLCGRSSVLSSPLSSFLWLLLLPFRCFRGVLFPAFGSSWVFSLLRGPSSVLFSPLSSFLGALFSSF